MEIQARHIIKSSLPRYLLLLHQLKAIHLQHQVEVVAWQEVDLVEVKEVVWLEVAQDSLQCQAALQHLQAQAPSFSLLLQCHQLRDLQ